MDAHSRSTSLLNMNRLAKEQFALYRALIQENITLVFIGTNDSYIYKIMDLIPQDYSFTKTTRRLKDKLINAVVFQSTIAKIDNSVTFIVNDGVAVKIYIDDWSRPELHIKNRSIRNCLVDVESMYRYGLSTGDFSDLITFWFGIKYTMLSAEEEVTSLHTLAMMYHNTASLRYRTSEEYRDDEMNALIANKMTTAIYLYIQYIAGKAGIPLIYRQRLRDTMSELSALGYSLPIQDRTELSRRVVEIEDGLSLREIKLILDDVSTWATLVRNTTV